MACNSLGLIPQKKKPIESKAMFHEGRNIALEMGEKWIIQQSLVNLGFSRFALPDVTEAQDCFLRATLGDTVWDIVPAILRVFITL